ncbi:hypothetical protein ACMWP8_29240, partial [Escherichia coli]|uniref:hypothetical protein n=1 Tax=Escherichia coli TaxID=562 RepID=UPI0039E14182
RVALRFRGHSGQGTAPPARLGGSVPSSRILDERASRFRISVGTDERAQHHPPLLRLTVEELEGPPGGECG